MECANSPLIWHQPDFYPGFGLDLIEEDAQNEMSCAQVLRILIAKADAEIEDLEESLVYLQSELAGEEHEEWYDICSDALKEKIDYLDSSLKSLRSSAGDCSSEPSSMLREPAERMHKILKPLLTNYLQKNHEKAVESAAGISRMDAQDNLNLNSSGKQEMTGPDSETESDESFQQVDVTVEFNNPNALEKRHGPKYGALGKESPGNSSGTEDKREDGDFSKSSIEQLQNQGSKSISEPQSRKEEVQRTGIRQLSDVTIELCDVTIQLCDVTVNDDFNLDLESRQKKRRKGLSGPGAERSKSPHGKISSAVSKTKVPRKLKIVNGSFSKPSWEKRGKKMVLALPALLPGQNGWGFQTSEERKDASVRCNSCNKEADSMLEEDMVITKSDELQDSPKLLVALPASNAIVNLEHMKINDLRAIAKKKKLKKYYRLRKKVLVERIASIMDSC